MLSSHSSLVSTVLNQDLVSLTMSGETVLALCILMDFFHTDSCNKDGSFHHIFKGVTRRLFELNMYFSP